MAVVGKNISKFVLVYDDADATKGLQIEVNAGATTGTKTTIQAAQTADRTITLPDVTDTLAAIAATQTFTNKTYTLGTANRVLETDGSSNISESATTSTELGYLSGVTSGIQTQIDGKADQDLGNLTSPTAVNQHLLPDAPGTRNLGSASAEWNNIHVDFTEIKNFRLVDNSDTITLSVSAGSNSFTGVTTGITVTSDNNSDANATPTHTTQVRTGNKTAGTGNSGNIILETGTSAGGTRGIIELDAERLRFDAQAASDPASPTTTDVYYNTTTNEFKYYNGTDWKTLGSALASGINYVTNPDFESSATDWSAYADAAQSTPEDGTGGSPTVTITRTTTDPQRGTGSGLITKDAANRQGEGVSTDFTIDRADRNKQIYISADIETSANYVKDDIQVFVYDVTNATLITPSRSGDNTRVTASFSATDSTSYRLIFHVASTNALAYTVKVDNVSVGPDVLIDSPIVTDWVEYTPEWTATTTNPTVGNGSIVGRWRRVGDTGFYQIRVNFQSTTTAGSGDYSFSLPTGQTMDASKIIMDGGALAPLGSGNVLDNLSQVYVIGSVSQSLTNTTVRLTYDSGSSTATIVGATAPITWATGDGIYLNFSAPISEWDNQSAILSSQEIINQTAKSKMTLETNQNVTADTSAVVVELDTIQFDDGAIASTSNNSFTIKKSGKYRLTGGVYVTGITTGNAVVVYFYRNGSILDSAFDTADSGSPTVFYTGVYDLVAGDEIQLRVSSPDGTYVVNNTQQRTQLTVEHLPDFTAFATAALPEKSIAPGKLTNAASNTRNYIINGALDFWQRGTSYSGSSATAFLADRFFYLNCTAASRSTDTPIDLPFSFDTAGSSFCGFGTSLEVADLINMVGKNVTLSVYAKSITGSTEVRAEINRANAPDDFSGITQVYNDVMGTINTSDFTRISYTFEMTSDIVTNGINIRMFTTAASNIRWSGVQLTQGETVLDFRRTGDTIGDELLLCERYYEVITNSIAGALQTATSADFSATYRVQKRAVPTITFDTGTYTASSAGANRTTSQANMSAFDTDGLGTGITAASLSAAGTAGHAIILRASSPAIRIDAEL